MVLFHLGDPLIDGFGRQIMRLHCCRVPDCKVLKHKRKALGNLLAGGRKAGTGQGSWEEVKRKKLYQQAGDKEQRLKVPSPSWARGG